MPWTSQSEPTNRRAGLRQAAAGRMSASIALDAREHGRDSPREANHDPHVCDRPARPADDQRGTNRKVRTRSRSQNCQHTAAPPRRARSGSREEQSCGRNFRIQNVHFRILLLPLDIRQTGRYALRDGRFNLEFRSEEEPNRRPAALSDLSFFPATAVP